MDKPSLFNAIEALKTATGVNSVTPEVLASIYENIILILEENIDGKYSEFSSLKSSFNNFLSSADTSNSTINRWKEIEAFLQGVTDTQTLTGLLEVLSAKLRANIEGNTTLINKETTRATTAEQTLTNSVNTERNRITQEITDRKAAINNLQSAISTETTNRTNEDTAIKNTMVKSRVSDNEEFNTIFKELYINKNIRHTNIKEIVISKDSGKIQLCFRRRIDDKLFYLTLIGDSNSLCHQYIGYGDFEDTNVIDDNKIFGQENVSIYAVIDESKVTKEYRSYGAKDILHWNEIFNIKYSPTINHYIDSYKYAQGINANAVFKELYFENLKVTTNSDGYTQLVNANAISKVLKFNSIHYAAESKSYSLAVNFIEAFYDKSGTESKAVFIKLKRDNNISISNSISVDMPNLKFECNAVYAVVDWNYLDNIIKETDQGEYAQITSMALGGVIDITSSPIIYNYIESEALRTQLAELTAQLANKEE